MADATLVQRKEEPCRRSQEEEEEEVQLLIYKQTQKDEKQTNLRTLRLTAQTQRSLTNLWKNKHESRRREKHEAH